MKMHLIPFTFIAAFLYKTTLPTLCSAEQQSQSNVGFSHIINKKESIAIYRVDYFLDQSISSWVHKMTARQWKLLMSASQMPR